MILLVYQISIGGKKRKRRRKRNGEYGVYIVVRRSGVEFFGGAIDGSREIYESDQRDESGDK